MRAPPFLIFVCIALGATGCDNSGDRQGSTAASSGAQSGPRSAPVNEVREPEPLPPGFTQEVFTFQGIPLGKPETWPLVVQLCEEMESNKSLGDCTPDSPIRDALIFQVSYGPSSGSLPLMGTFAFSDDDTGRLEEAWVMGSETYMEELAVALTMKYGAPMGASAELQNLYGATRDSQVFSWQDSVGNRLVLITLDPNIGLRGYGRAIFKSVNRIEKENAVEEARREAATDNL